MLPFHSPRRLALAGSAVAILVAGPAWAVSDQECSTKFKAAEDNKTLAGQSYEDFRKIQCGGPTGITKPGAAPGQPPATEPSHQPSPAGAAAPTQG